jgi:regulator of sigma E protease
MELLNTGFNLLLIILGFGLLIFVHELGHFIAAKWAGIRTEAFAIGMGPVVTSWRKGIGFATGSTHKKVIEKTGKPAVELNDEDLSRHGIGETEYSLRWLPIGGFVKMLGQEDTDPTAVSNDPRSYNVCPVGKRMLVVSAGVVMNVLLAVVLFIAAFIVGVKFESPVIGDVSSTLPAGITRPVNAEALGVTAVGLQPGDVVVRIDGKAAETFADIQIASAMSKPGQHIDLVVERDGVSEPLEFDLLPEKDPFSGLLSIGVAPASSTTLRHDAGSQIDSVLHSVGLAQQGIQGGMRLVSVDGRDVSTFEQLQRAVGESDGRPIDTVWSHVDGEGKPTGDPVDATLAAEPLFQPLIYPQSLPDTPQNSELGLVGLTPLVKIIDFTSDRNKNVVHVGDVVLRAAGLEGPRMAEFTQEVRRRKGGSIDLLVLRDGEEVQIQPEVDRKGMIGVAVANAWENTRIARPFEQVRSSLDPTEEAVNVTTPVGPLLLAPRTAIDAVAGTPVTDWKQIRAALREATAEAFEQGAGARVAVTISEPTSEQEQNDVTLVLTADDVEALHGLSWTTGLPSVAFEPIYVTRSAGGNPAKAVAMGFEETKKLILMTYLTIDRLIRGSVGVEQLRGPVGIVHLGTKIADRGFIYLVFLLAVVSVNLAVINFLPLPIVDGGLFLFLIYEKVKGKPPSVAFQNAAFIFGLFLIGTAFVVTFYNDVARLIG